jgi:hypothetical protein
MMMIIIIITWFSTCFDAGILLALFDPEDGGNMFLRNLLYGVISQETVLLDGPHVPDCSRKYGVCSFGALFLSHSVVCD